MSYIERSARKLYPILCSLKKRMIPEKKREKDKEGDETDSDSNTVIDLSKETGIEKDKADMKNILGYLNQGEWTSKLSIGSFM
jgi:hypothetical protein